MPDEDGHHPEATGDDRQDNDDQPCERSPVIDKAKAALLDSDNEPLGIHPRAFTYRLFCVHS